MIYKMAALLLVAGVVFGMASDVRADDLSKWESDKVRLEEILDRKSSDLSEEQACQAIWNILWPAAKEGNLEARAQILFMLAPPVDGDRIIMPGRSDDSITQVRDSLIMAVHSTGVVYQENKYNKVYEDTVDILYSGFHVENLNGEKFLACLKRARSAECGKLAAEDKFVPAFDMYAAEIDNAISQGRLATCLPAYIHPVIVE